MVNGGVMGFHNKTNPCRTLLGQWWTVVVVRGGSRSKHQYQQASVVALITPSQYHG